MRSPETVAAVFDRMQTLISAMRRCGTEALAARAF
jgi:hypothetical protein